MANIELVKSTGDADLDKLLSGVIKIIETVFPGKIRAYYLSGSFSEGMGVDIGRNIHSSDIDVYTIFKGSLPYDHPDFTLYREIIAACNGFSRLVLDMHPTGETELFATDKGLGNFLGVLIKDTGKLLYGEDIRDQIPVMPLDHYLMNVINHGVYHSGLTRQGGKPTGLPLNVPMTFPVCFPDPNGELYGYEFRRKPEDPPGTRLLITIALWCAALNLALKTGRYSSKKGQTARLYAELVQDEWSDLVKAVHDRLKVEWKHQIPTDTTAQEELRAIATQVLSFENQFLRQTREFLLGQLRGGDSQILPNVVEILQSVIYDDAEIRGELKKLADDTNSPPEIQESVRATLKVYG
jgi:hypothetical protein